MEKPIVETLSQLDARLDTAAEIAWQQDLPLSEAMKLFRQALVKKAVRECHGNQVRAAQELGIHRNTIRKILRGQW